MYQKTVLNNGLRIITSSMKGVRSVGISVFVGTGSCYESDEEAGISHFVEHLLFKGTSKRASAKEIAESIETVGGYLNGGTDKEDTVYWAKVSSPHLGKALDLLADMIRNSKFDSAEIEKERQVIAEEISMSIDSPDHQVSMLIDNAIWPNQALGRDVAGHKETVAVITRQMLIDYWARQYVPNNMVISIAGDVQHDTAVEMIDRLFGDWASGPTLPRFPAQNGRKGPSLLLEHRDVEQAHICLALPGISNRHPDRYAFDMLNIILGEGMSSRLFLELREKRGLAYGVHSYVTHFFDSGSLNIYVGVDPSKIEVTIETILAELMRFRNEVIPESELEKAKEMGKGSLLLRMEDTRSVSGWLGAQDILLSEIRTIDEVIEAVDSITTHDLARVATEILDFSELSLAIVGPSPGEERLRQLISL